MQTQHLLHKHGARITAIHAVEHDQDGKVPIWFFKGDLLFEENGKVTPMLDREIAPYHLVVDGTPEAEAELNRALQAMNAHLQTQGRWHKQKRVGDRVVSWTPKQKAGSTKIA